jgi:hypothetical protein
VLYNFSVAAAVGLFEAVRQGTSGHPTWPGWICGWWSKSTSPCRWPFEFWSAP